EALGSEDARDLARAWLEGQADPEQQAVAIAREAQGIPFFVHEFVRHIRTVGTASVSRTSLDDVLQARIARLPDEARRVLEVAATAAYPIAQSLALEVAGAAQGATTLGLLRAEHMIRTERSRADDTLVTYHDRIRIAVLRALEIDATRAIHRRIASALWQRQVADPEALTFHLMSGGEPEAAAAEAVKAADRASELLAFDRAVHYYRLALSLATRERTSELELRRKLAEALANAGRGAESADEFLRTADGVAGHERSRLRQRAAEQLIRCGDPDRGLDTIGELFREIGLWLPRRRFSVLVSLVFHRVRLWFRRYRIQTTQDPKLPRLVDLYQSFCFALSFSDPMRGYELHSRAMLLALRLGEPHRLCRAFVNEALLLAASGA